MVNKKRLDTIFSVKNEDYYFYLSLYNNIFDNDNKKILKLQDILILLKKIIKINLQSHYHYRVKQIKCH